MNALRTIPPEADEVHLWMLRSPPASCTSGAALKKPQSLQSQYPNAKSEFPSAAANVLGRDLGIPPHQVVFGRNPYGKPHLSGSSAVEHPNLRFNVSHAPGLAIVAITVGREVGIDVESLDHPPAALPAAMRYFHSAEQAALKQLSSQELIHPLLHCWTSKEAFIKGIGQGLRAPLNAFAVSCDQSISPMLLRVEPGCPVGWALYSLPLPCGYVGALALQRGCCRVTCKT
jgi:4'-phosphopantetheinyl transferase